MDDPHGESVENEVFISVHCVSNSIKETMFVFFLICNGTLFLASWGSLTYYNIVSVYRLKWNPFNRTFLATLVATLCNIGRLSFFITGTASRWKYLLFPFPFIFVACPAIELGYSWFCVNKRMHGMGELDTEDQRKYKRIITITIISAVFGYLVFGGIGPLFSFDNPWILNWFYCLMLVLNNILALAICLSYIHFGRKFLKDLREWKASSVVIHPGDQDSNTQAPKIIRGVNNTLRVAIFFLIPTFLLIWLPIVWILVTQTPEEPGMQYFFYVQFFMIEFYPLVGMAAQAYFQLTLPHPSRNNTAQNNKKSSDSKEARNHHHSSRPSSVHKHQQQHQQEDSQDELKFSFTVKELQDPSYESQTI